MSKLTRVAQKAFGSSGPSGDFGQFGSLAAGAVNYTKDPTTIQSLSAWLTGWAAATIANNRPALEDMNSLFYLAFYQIGYLLQQGVPEWDPDTTYYTNSYVQVSGVIYKSLQDTNLNQNPTTETAYWSLYDSTPAGIIAMWSGTVATIPSGWYLCDGSNSTPDLRDKFIIGAKQDSGGVAKTNVTGSLTQTGGEATHVLTEAELAAHTHSIALRTGVGGTQSGADAASIGGTISTGSTGSSTAHNTLPPYYALAYIMKG